MNCSIVTQCFFGTMFNVSCDFLFFYLSACGPIQRPHLFFQQCMSLLTNLSCMIYALFLWQYVCPEYVLFALSYRSGIVTDCNMMTLPSQMLMLSKFWLSSFLEASCFCWAFCYIYLTWQMCHTLIWWFIIPANNVYQYLLLLLVVLLFEDSRDSLRCWPFLIPRMTGLDATRCRISLLIVG